MLCSPFARWNLRPHLRQGDTEAADLYACMPRCTTSPRQDDTEAADIDACMPGCVISSRQEIRLCTFRLFSCTRQGCFGLLEMQESFSKATERNVSYNASHFLRTEGSNCVGLRPNSGPKSAAEMDFEVAFCSLR